MEIVSIGDVVNKVRRVVKLFKRSHLKNEILQTYVKEKHPNGLQDSLEHSIEHARENC